MASLQARIKAEAQLERETGTTRLTPSQIAYFWSRIDRSGDGCWNWTASLNREGGYGRFQINGKQTLGHRLAYELTYGPIPANMIVCHKCDNRRCCRPDHLFLGTSRDNALDAVRKGRLPHTAGILLTADEIREIVQAYEGGESQVSIASRYGVSRYSIWRVVSRHGRKHDAHTGTAGDVARRLIGQYSADDLRTIVSILSAELTAS